MPEKSGQPLILIACACAVFWPGAFIFGFPGVMSQHWRIAFHVNDSEVGRTIFFILIGATCFMYPGFSHLGLMYFASAGLILLVRPWQECRL
jgi:hypothetical protein